MKKGFTKNKPILSSCFLIFLLLTKILHTDTTCSVVVDFSCCAVGKGRVVLLVLLVWYCIVLAVVPYHSSLLSISFITLTTLYYNSRVPYHTLPYPIIAQLEHYRTDGRCQSRVKKDRSSFEKRIVLSPARSHKQKAPEILSVSPPVKFGLRQHDGFQAPRGGNEEKN
eukprot:scaffold19447_cov137-Amphora_coffeaeformis.AAC.1